MNEKCSAYAQLPGERDLNGVTSRLLGVLQIELGVQRF